MRSAFIAALAGAALALCGLPHAWSYLTPLPLAALFAFTATAPTPRAGAARMFWAGLAFFSLTLYWLPESFGRGYGPAFGLMFVALFVLEALFWAAVGGLGLRLARRVEARVVLLAVLWVVLEWLRHLGQLGFPWGTLGYTLLPTPVAQVADLGGVLLLSLLVTFAAATLVLAVRGHYRPLLAGIAVWGAAAAYGLTRAPVEGEPGRALLVLTDIDSFDKASGSGVDRLLADNLRLTEQAEPGEIPIWSETVVWAYDPEDLRGVVPDREMLLGVSFAGRNSAVSWDGQVRGTYDKMQLVPFGEYYPATEVLRPLYEYAYRNLGLSFSPPVPGEVARPVPLGGREYGVYVCYDSVFPTVATALVRGGAQVLVNVSNDGWYGKSVGVEQHFQMGRMRAIETRRYVLRSVNQGVAAVIDERGRVLERLSGSEGVVHARFEYLEGETLFVRFGYWPLLFLLVALFVWGLWLDRRRGPLDW